MQIQFFCPRWGSEKLSWTDFLSLAKSAGYDGVEYAIAANTPDQELDYIWNEAARADMSIIAQHYDTYTANYSKHLDGYGDWLNRMRNYPVVKINSQTGKDFFGFEENRMMIGMAEVFSKQTGTSIVHETHRNKFSFAAHITADYLNRIPNLRLTLDASHWVCVAESYLEDQQVEMDFAISRTDHIHARVGYPEGPQVTNPLLPEWSAALNAHLAWWDAVVDLKRRESNSLLTITPEYGPYPYSVEMPVSRLPLGDQWNINVEMMNLLRDRYEG